MKKIYKNPYFLCFIFVILMYVAAEIVIKVNALNHISFGIAGLLLIIGIAVLVIKFFLYPLFSFKTFPQWIEPEDLPDPKKQKQQLSDYAEWLRNQYKNDDDVPESLRPLVKRLKQSSKLKNEPSKHLAELKKILPEFHQKLSTEVCDDIIAKYMKRTAIMVIISQRGWLDSLILLIMQVKMIRDIAKALGYRPNWRLLLSCFAWIIANSILFSLFDESTALEETAKEILPEVTGEKTSGEKIAAFLFGKISGMAVQGVSSMAVLYATGKIVKIQLLEGQKTLSNKERITFRINGYKEAWKILGSVIGNSIKSIKIL